jgi:hypothetical protein
MKTIVFTKAKSDDGKVEIGDDGKVEIGDAVEAGYQVDIFPGGRTASDLKAVDLNDHTEAEIQKGSSRSRVGDFEGF